MWRERNPATEHKPANRRFVYSGSEQVDVGARWLRPVFPQSFLDSGDERLIGCRFHANTSVACLPCFEAKGEVCDVDVPNGAGKVCDSCAGDAQLPILRIVLRCQQVSDIGSGERLREINSQNKSFDSS